MESLQGMPRVRKYKDNDLTPAYGYLGDITQAASYQSREAPVARVEPNRKWYGAWKEKEVSRYANL
jgi:hypothetical protein